MPALAKQRAALPMTALAVGAGPPEKRMATFLMSVFGSLGLTKLLIFRRKVKKVEQVVRNYTGYDYFFKSKYGSFLDLAVTQKLYWITDQVFEQAKTTLTRGNLPVVQSPHSTDKRSSQILMSMVFFPV